VVDRKSLDISKKKPPKKTVRAWLERFGIPAEDHFFIKWNDTLFKLITAIQELEGKGGVTDKGLGMLWNGIFMALYVDYDTQKEFYPQFETNAFKMLGWLSELDAAIE